MQKDRFSFSTFLEFGCPNYVSPKSVYRPQISCKSAPVIISKLLALVQIKITWIKLFRSALITSERQQNIDKGCFTRKYNIPLIALKALMT